MLLKYTFTTEPAEVLLVFVLKKYDFSLQPRIEYLLNHTLTLPREGKVCGAA